MKVMSLLALISALTLPSVVSAQTKQKSRPKPKAESQTVDPTTWDIDPGESEEEWHKNKGEYAKGTNAKKNNPTSEPTLLDLNSRQITNPKQDQKNRDDLHKKAQLEFDNSKYDVPDAKEEPEKDPGEEALE